MTIDLGALEDALAKAKAKQNDTPFLATWANQHGPAMIATIQAQAERVRVLEDALRQVIAWDLPRVPDLHRPGSNVSYGFVYGSNGERDYFRAIARAALGDKS